MFCARDPPELPLHFDLHSTKIFAVYFKNDLFITCKIGLFRPEFCNALLILHCSTINFAILLGAKVCVRRHRSVDVHMSNSLTFDHFGRTVCDPSRASGSGKRHSKRIIPFPLCVPHGPECPRLGTELPFASRWRLGRPGGIRPGSSARNVSNGTRDCGSDLLRNRGLRRGRFPPPVIEQNRFCSFGVCILLMCTRTSPAFYRAIRPHVYCRNTSAT